MRSAWCVPMEPRPGMRTPDMSWHQIVRSEGCITGALKRLCHRAAVGLLRATEALGGCDIEGVLHAVLGEQGRARAQALVRESEVDTHVELRQQVANLTETNVRLERAVHTHTRTHTHAHTHARAHARAHTHTHTHRWHTRRGSGWRR